MTFPVLSADEMTSYYSASYYGTGNRRFNPLFEWLVTIFRRRRVRKIERFVAKGRVLDIGCGRGITLSQLKEDGWEISGVEISETAATHARSLLGETIFVGDILAAPWPADSFDVINIWHVLEHLPDPAGVLSKCGTLLRPGGLLVVAVPNFESLQAGFAGPLWFHLDVPRHYWHFGEKVLRALLEEKGFAVRETSHFSFEQNPYGWIQSLLNRLGFPYNLLYDSLKHESARNVVHPLRVYPIWSLLLAPALLLIVPVALTLFFVEVLLRRGGTIELYAVLRK
ncbi:MAG: class I SAM-dependent methyltransferase [Thermoanaerobaculia bacterium]|nr:class I SAM-dependent methyltransferase [Thermoanaerobaculia bacterium]